MYPRNAASPEPIAIGPVVQISDGAVQTSGVTVRIKPIGVSEADGVGTTAYSTDGIVLYTPTQAETNYTSFILIAAKSGCLPASINVITGTAANIAGVADTGSTTTSITIKSIEITSITEADQLKGRIVIFDKNTATAALRGQGAPIEGGSTSALVISAGNALTTAPSEDDTFTIY